MTGYELTKRLIKTRRRYVLSASAQALYHELGIICNEDEWPDIFTVSNDELCKALNISEKTLIDIRQSLIQAKLNEEERLIYYQSGQSKKKFGSYSFTVNFTANKGTNTTANKVVNAPANPSDSIKTKKETKDNSGTNVPGTESKKQKKKKQAPEYVTPHWPALVAEWHRFNKEDERLKCEVSFKDADPRNFKKIVDNLQKRAESKNIEWTEIEAVRRLNKFLQSALDDKWLPQNFLLNNLNNQFDKIIANATTKATTNSTAVQGKPGATANRGASVTDLQSLKRGGVNNPDERDEFSEAQVVE